MAPSPARASVLGLTPWRAALAVACAASALSACTVTRARYPDPGLPDGPHPMLARAEQAYLRGNLDEALGLYRGYRDGFAGSAGVATIAAAAAADSWYWEGVILLEQGRVDGAEAAFARAARDPGSRFIEAQSEMGLGDCAWARERWPEAVTRYQRALDLRVPEARNDYALYRLGVARQRIGDWGGGQSYFHLVLRDHPRSPLVPRVRERLAQPARAFHVELGRFSDASAAARARVDVQSRGVDARVVGVGEGTFAVWVGPFRRFEDARAETAALALATGIDGTVVP